MNLPPGLVFHNVYEAMEGEESDHDYLANVALAALQGMKHLVFPETQKNSVESKLYREEGNKAYKSGSFQKALLNYNKAMAYAPNGSICLKLAYSNRSAVLFTAKEYIGCQKDCVKALSINCPTPNKLIEKLEKRKSQAQSEQKKMGTNPFQQDNILFQNFADKFYKLKSRNGEIPCASGDVDVVIESGVPKVIAKRDIAAGALVALEKAFVSWTLNDSDQYFSCHYCRKLSVDLFPCSGCVSAMFCSEQCEKSCMAEYHTNECKIAGFIVGTNEIKNWVVKATLKLINMCATWDELISMSYDYGYDRLKKGTVNEIYDGENPSSILSFHKDRHFLAGPLFNNAIICGYYLNFLQNLKSFLPDDCERKLLATQAIARIMMYLMLYSTSTMLLLVTNVITTQATAVHNRGHWGLFPFVGKLKHACMPNLQILALNNSIGLVALERIKTGTELTISQYALHWVETDQKNNERKVQMFSNHNEICTCVVCSTSLEDRQKNIALTAAQKRAVQECFSVECCRVFGISIDDCLEKIYKAFASLHDIRFSADYVKVFKMLQKLQLYVLDKKLCNNILSTDLYYK